MSLDPLLLSRIQFGLTVTFHIIFPSLSIGLSLYLAVLEGLWLKTGRELYLQLYTFWIRVFAMSFGVGVATGIVLSFEFGLNFSGFSRFAGPAIGPMIAMEVLTAFFLEAGFLGIMLFGRERVGKRLHFFATCMVALGTHISATWILSANSWMQTPAGIVVVGDHVEVTDWWAVVFNPSFVNRAVHMVLAAHLSTAFFAAGIAAWYLLKRQHIAFARRSLELSMSFAAALIGCQILAGGLLADVMGKAQPGKFTAIEGHWKTGPRASFLVAAWPDPAREQNRFEIGIPLLASQLVGHSVDTIVHGIKDVPADRRPPTATVFWSFRTMFYLTIVMFGTAFASMYLRLRGRQDRTRWFLRLCVAMTPSGIIATIAGWYVAEIGRQPFVVNGLLRTADAVSPVPAGSVMGSLAALSAVDLLFLSAFVALTIRAVARGPGDGEAPVSGPLKRAIAPESPGALTPAAP